VAVSSAIAVSPPSGARQAGGDPGRPASQAARERPELGLYLIEPASQVSDRAHQPVQIVNDVLFGGAGDKHRLGSFEAPAIFGRIFSGSHNRQHNPGPA
jgi:hypothetical protein